MQPQHTISVIKQIHWDEYIALLREVPLAGDPSIKPYKHAKISSRIVDVEDVFPISLYLLQSHLDTQNILYEVFKRDYDIDIMDLDGGRPGVIFRTSWEKGTWRLSPPIVEVSDNDDGKPLLLDGEHRFMLAGQLNRKVRVVWIENVPAEYPVVAKPIRWDEVKIYAQVPGLAEKRVYRYPDLSHFPDVSSFTSINSTEKNFRYFFYRDISRISSSSIREVGSK